MINIKNHGEVKVNLLDSASGNFTVQELLALTFKKQSVIDVVIFCYSIVDSGSYEEAQEWISSLEAHELHNNVSYKLALIATKADLSDERRSVTEN